MLSHRSVRLGALVVLGLLGGCAQDGAVPSDPDNEFTEGVQSETSMVRALGPSGAPRLVLGYDDVLDQVDATGNYLTNYSLLGPIRYSGSPSRRMAA